MTPSLPPVKTRAVRRAAAKVGPKITKSLARLAEEAGVLDGAVIERWADIVGPELFALCRPVRMKRGKGARTLVVAVPHGAAATMVEFRKTEILSRAQSVLGPARVTRLAIEQPGGAAVTARGRGSRNGKPFRSQMVYGAAAPDRPATPAAAPRPAENVDEALDRLAASLGLR